MTTPKGIFSIIYSVIRESEKDGRFVVSKEDIEKEVRKQYDMESIDREFLEYTIMDLYIGIALSQNGYLSPFRGKRMFVKPEKLRNRAVLERIRTNFQGDQEKFEIRFNQLLKKIEEQSQNIMENQFTFDENFEETGEYKRTPSEEEMMEMLKELCRPQKEEKES